MNKSRKESQSNRNSLKRNPLKRNPSRSLSKRNQPKASHSQVFHCLPHPIPAILLTGLLLIGCGYNTQKSAAPAAVTPAHPQPSSHASAESQTGNPQKTQEETTEKNAEDLGREKAGDLGEETTGESGKETTAKATERTIERTTERTAVRTTEKTTAETIRQARTMDFTIQESPVDMARYDKQTDQRYKEAFLKAVTNQIPIHFPNQGGTSFYKDLVFGAEEMEEGEFQDAVRQSDYFYQDFDGDGLPELTVNTRGTCVLKYHPREDKVELYHQKGEGWNLLGKGQMVAEFTEYTKDTTELLYCYEDSGREFCLRDVLTRLWDGWESTYRISLDGCPEMEVEEEIALEILEGYFQAAKNAPHPMTFTQLFGDGEHPGYQPGEELLLWYWMEDREHLPVNEEKGEEWEAYKAMLEGDFSLVEDERWGSLQSNYEDSLEEGDGRCGWSYFLMDFNQDGVKELVVRLYREGVNNTASFYYDKGKIKMWGTYHSADSHGYALPLANGRMLSVYWYQDTKVWWIKRLDSQCREIKEGSYSTGEIRETSDSMDESGESPDSNETGAGEAKKNYYYQFLDYYHDGTRCGDLINLSEEEWGQVEEWIESLQIPEEVWKPCSVFTPKRDRPDVPGVG